MSGASSSSDPFGRRSAGAPTLGAPIHDHFREQMERKAGKRPQPQGDAFAPKAARPAPAPKPAPAPRPVREREAPKAARTRDEVKAERTKPGPKKAAVTPPVAMRRDRDAEDDFRNALGGAPAFIADPGRPDTATGASNVEASDPAARRSLLGRGKLKLVRRQDEAEPVVEQAAASGAEVRRLKKAGRSSSLVLVSGSSAVAEAEAPAESAGGSGGTAAGTAETTETRKAARSGGAPPGGGGGGPRAPTPVIDRAFNQDDLMAALMVLALLLLAAMYFMRGESAKAPPQPLMSVQSASVEKEIPAPVGPPPDPHGDKPIDLTPKSAMPAPPPAPICPSEHTLRAWFCTDRAELTDAAKASLDRDLAEWSQCFKGKELVVSGYADTRGPSEYNSSLGGARANVVADYLKARGIKVAGLKGIGELSGLTDNENCANQRRVDIMFAGDEAETPMRTCAPPKDFAELVCG